MNSTRVNWSTVIAGIAWFAWAAVSETGGAHCARCVRTANVWLGAVVDGRAGLAVSLEVLLALALEAGVTVEALGVGAAVMLPGETLVDGAHNQRVELGHPQLPPILDDVVTPVEHVLNQSLDAAIEVDDAGVAVEVDQLAGHGANVGRTRHAMGD